MKFQTDKTVEANALKSEAQHTAYFRLRARYAQLAVKVTLSSLKSNWGSDEIVNQSEKQMKYADFNRGGDLRDTGNRKKEG